jgi:squalene synthase HpnC
VSQLARSVDAARREPIQASDENFPVASRLLPGRLRRDLHALYGVARAIDDVGDDAPGDRLTLLAEFEAELRLIWTTGAPHLPVLVALVPTVRDRGLAIDPFLSLIEANRLDQTQSVYPAWTDLRHYCSLSADPVGRIVLSILGATRPDRVALSDDVCTALQLLEHCQDVAEDRRRGRTYLPLADLADHGVHESDLDADVTTPAVRAVVAFEVARAEALLGSGPQLVKTLRGAGRVAVAGYVAGGLATVDALRRADFEVLGLDSAKGRDVVPSPRRRDIARHALRLLAGRS